MESIKCLLDLLKIVTINGDNFAAKCFEFCINRSCIHDIFGSAIDLQTVNVNDDAEIVKFVVSSKHCSFPNLSFRKLTITKKCINMNIFSKIFCTLCHSGCGRDTLSERTCRHINARYSVHVRVSLKIRIYVTKIRKIAYREKTAESESRVKTRCSMTF